MTPRELLESAGALFLDFDGPLAALMPRPKNAEAADAARAPLRDLELPDEISSTTDHLAVLRYTRANHPERLLVVEQACTSAETAAALTCSPGHHAQTLLDFAGERDLPVAVVSNNSDRAVRAFMLRHDWDDRVHAYACRTPKSVDFLKPRPDLLFLAADALHLDVSTAVLVGDSVSDVLAARSAGTRCLGLAKDAGRAVKLVDAGASSVASLHESLEREFMHEPRN